MKVAKISIKELGFSAKEIRKSVEGKIEAVFLARIGGYATEAFSGESDTGTWTGFKGVFSAINSKKEEFTASVAYFPGNVTSGLEKSLSETKKEVAVAVDVFAVETTKNSSGYAYVCEPVLTPELASKMKSITDNLLSAPLPNEPVKLASNKK
jgi:hypothetical protein